MALKKKKPKKPAKTAVDITLWDVCLSFPDLHSPKPFKGKIYYKTDVLMKPNHPGVKLLRKAIDSVCANAFGEDSSEWPDKLPVPKDGSEREDQKGYEGKKYITASTQTPVPVIDQDDNDFNPKMVRGGMFANVAVRVSAWEFDGDVGVSIYLQGVQIDTEKEALNFGGGKSVKQMFKRDTDESDEESEDDEDEDEDADFDDEEEELPKKKKKPTKRVIEEDDEDEESDFDDEEEEDYKPKKKKKKPASSRYDDEDEE